MLFRSKDLELHLYALSDGAETVCRIPDLSGRIVMTAKVVRLGDTITFETDCSEKKPVLVIHGMAEVTRVEGDVKVERK